MLKNTICQMGFAKLLIVNILLLVYNLLIHHK
nr:MAG TPA: hypothetical protein [Caudoviricetes sp.]